MTIREKVTLAVRQFGQDEVPIRGLISAETFISNRDDLIAIAAINAFLAAAAEAGWRMRPDEATDEMHTAGDRWCWVDGAPKCWRDMGKAAPEFEVE